jgi:hypothetical protein
MFDEYEQQSIQRFEELVKSFNGNWIAAKEWQHEIYKTNGDDSYLEFSLGLPLGYLMPDVVKIQRD